jgi:hypothetical protein
MFSMVSQGVPALILCLGTLTAATSAVAAQAPTTKAPAKPPAKGPAKPAAAPAVQCGADVAKALVGAWKAPQYRIKRTSDVGQQVFGPNAVDVRDVDLTIQASGEGDLKISMSVVDQKGKSWAPSAVEAKVMIGAGKTSAAGRCEVAVTVTSAKEEYLDATKFETPLTGANVILLLGTTPGELDLRYEPPKGQGAFWTTLRRGGPTR